MVSPRRRSEIFLDGQLLRDMRTAAGLTLRDVAVAVGVSHVAVLTWERSAPPQKRIAPLLAVLQPGAVQERAQR